MFYYIARITVYIVLMIFYKPRFEGLENVPKDKGFILVSNHISNFDPIFVAVKVKPRCYFMAKEELFRNPFVSLIIRGLGAFPGQPRQGGHRRRRKGGRVCEGGQGRCDLPRRAQKPRRQAPEAQIGAVVIAAETGGGMQPCVVRKGRRRGSAPRSSSGTGSLSPTRSWASPAAPRPRSGRPISCSPKP